MRGLSDTIINFKKGTNNYGIKDIIDLLKVDLLKANGKVADSCFVGIRNNYINIYYRGNSMMKVTFDDTGAFKEAIIHKKFWDNKLTSDYVNITDYNLLKPHKIKSKISALLGKKNVLEKERQQMIIQQNNTCIDTKWFCVDMEYIMERKNSDEDNYGRFDIVAISTERNSNNKYVVSLVELKLGADAFSGITEEARLYLDNKIQNGEYLKVTDSIKIGSGIVGHFSDFIRYLEDTNYNQGVSRFDVLKQEIVNVLKNYQALGLLAPQFSNLATDIDVVDIEVDPKVIFLLYSKEHTIQSLESVKKSFNNYVLSKNNKDAAHFAIDKIWDDKIIAKYSTGSKKIGCVFRTPEYKGPIFSDLDISEANGIFEKHKTWSIS